MKADICGYGWNAAKYHAQTISTLHFHAFRTGCYARLLIHRNKAPTGVAIKFLQIPHRKAEHARNEELTHGQ